MQNFFSVFFQKNVADGKIEIAERRMIFRFGDLLFFHEPAETIPADFILFHRIQIRVQSGNVTHDVHHVRSTRDEHADPDIPADGKISADGDRENVSRLTESVEYDVVFRLNVHLAEKGVAATVVLFRKPFSRIVFVGIRFHKPDPVYVFLNEKIHFRIAVADIRRNGFARFHIPL